MSYFKFNDIKSDDLGIRIQSKSIYSSPKYDVSLISVPGRNGDLVDSSGRYGNINVSYTCYLPAKSISELSEKLTKVKNWLYSGSNKYCILTDSYDDSYQRKAIFNSKLDIADEAMKIGTFTITFSCYPFKYLKNGLNGQTITDATTLSNPYIFNSKPYLKIYGEGKGTLVINNSIWNFSSIDEYVECDSELMNFYKEFDLKNESVSGDGFPILKNGNNTISFSGGITKIEIIPRWVTL